MQADCVHESIAKKIKRNKIIYWPIMTQMAGAFSQPGPFVHLSEISDKNQTCQPGRITAHTNVQPGPATRQTPFLWRGNVPLSGHNVNKFQRPAVLQLNIESLTASKINVLHHLAVQYEAPVILLQETHCTCTDKLAIPCLPYNTIQYQYHALP